MQVPCLVISFAAAFGEQRPVVDFDQLPLRAIAEVPEKSGMTEDGLRECVHLVYEMFNVQCGRVDSASWAGNILMDLRQYMFVHARFNQNAVHEQRRG